MNLRRVLNASPGAAAVRGERHRLAAGGCGECATVTGLTEDEWRRLAEIADSYDPADGFMAMRGFEWSRRSRRPVT